MDNPFLTDAAPAAPEVNYKSTKAIKASMNDDGLLPEVEEENPFLVKSEETNPFLATPKPKQQVVIEKTKPKSTILEDVQQAGKGFTNSMVSQSSMAAAGALEVAKKLPFMGQFEDTISQYQDRIFKNMEESQKGISEISGGSAGKDPGVGGAITTMGLQILPMLAGGKTAAPLIVERMLTETFTNKTQEMMKKTGGDIETSKRIAAVESLSNVLDVGLIATKMSPLSAIITNAIQNPVIGFKSRQAIEEYLSQLGYKDLAEEYNPQDLNQLIAEAVIGGAIPAVMHASDKIGQKKAKPVDFDPTEKSPLTPKNEVFDPTANPEGPQNADFLDPTKAAEGAYPPIDPAFKDESYTDLDASQTRFADSMLPEETNSGRTPDTPLGDRVFPNEEGPAGQFPKLDEEFATDRPDAWESDWKRSPIPEERIPYQEPQGDVPFDPFKDVSEPTEPTGYPRLPNALPEIATVEGEPGTHGMNFYEETPVGGKPLNYFVDQAKVDAANAQGLQGVSKMGFRRLGKNERGMADYSILFTGISKGYAKLASALSRSKNLGQAMQALKSYAFKENLGHVWDAINKVLDKDIPFIVQDWHPDANKRDASLEGGIGVHSIEIPGNPRKATPGSRSVRVRGDSYAFDGKQESGLNLEVPFHEIAHSVSEGAIRVGFDPELRTQPKYKAHRKYAEDMLKLATDIYNRVADLHKAKDFVLDNLDDKTRAAWEYIFSRSDGDPSRVTAELNAYGWSDKDFRKFLASIDLPNHGKNALQAFVDNVKRFFGFNVKDKTALQAIDSFLDRLNDVQGVSKEDFLKTVENKVNGVVINERFMKDINHIDNGFQLLEYLKDQETGDLGYAIIKDTPLLRNVVDFVNQYFVTTNQLPNIYKHPVVAWVAKHIPQIHRDAEARLSAYKEYLNDVVALKRPDQLTLFKKLVDINAPDLLDARREAVANGTQKEFLISQGMPEHLVEHGLRVLEVMKHVYESDRTFAKSLGRNLPEQPLYFPRSHGGTFKFHVKSADGKIQYIKGFNSAIEAQKYQTEMAKSLEGNPDGYTISPVERVDVPGFMDSIGQMLIDADLPVYLKNQVKDLEKKIDSAKRRFEMERAARDVGGYIGEVLHNDKGAGAAENNRLLDLLNNRIDDSYRFEVNSRIVNEITNPIVWNEPFMMGKPRLAKVLNDIVLRELGHDISKVKPFDDMLQNTMDDVSKWINKEAAKILDYKASDISMLSPDSVKRMTQNMVWITSAWKLGWNLPVLTINTLTIPMVAADGVRTAFKEGKNPLLANLAYMKFGTAPFDKGATEFMQSAKREGMIEARAADLFTITESHGARGTQKKFDNVINAARNLIEEKTNFFTILYYYNYYKLTEPNLSQTSDTFKKKVYSAARSWTGDYRQSATPRAISAMGVPGQASSNFSKWMMNQNGRFLADLADIRDNPTKLQAYMPVIANMSTIILLAGLYGVPGVVDYEYWRNLGRSTGLWDWKPFAGFYTEAQEWSKKHTGMNPLPDWLRRGVFTEINEELTKSMTGGAESGLDISGSLRHTTIMQANTVMLKTFFDIMKTGSLTVKAALDAAEVGSGWTEQNTKDYINGLPTGLQNVFEDYFIKPKYKRDDGSYIVQGRFKEEGNYVQTPLERKYEIAGFRSKRQNTYNDIRQYSLWLERSKKEKIGELIAGTMNNLDKPSQVSKNLNELYSVGGQTAVDNFLNQLENRKLNKMTGYDERLIQEVINSSDPSSKKDAIRIIKQFQQLKSGRTSEDR